MSFDGTIASSSSGIGNVVMNASGDGAISICCGEVREQNLTTDLLMALTDHTSGDAATTAADIPSRAPSGRLRSRRRFVARRDAVPGHLRRRDDRAGQRDLRGPERRDRALPGEATGSVSRGCARRARNRLADAGRDGGDRGAGAAVRRMFGAGGKARGAVLSLAGRWPDVDVRVDVRTAIARLMAPWIPRLLAIGPRVAGDDVHGSVGDAASGSRQSHRGRGV